MTTQPDVVIEESDELQSLRMLVRDILEAEAKSDRLRRFDDEEAFDLDLYQSLARAGLVQLDADVSGPQASYQNQAVVLEELGATATSMAVCFVVQYIGVHLLTNHGSSQQRRDVLEPLLSGDARISFALTEPDGGTDVARLMRTKATPNQDGSYTLTGSKMWISGAADAEYMFVVARTGSVGKSSIDGITMFLIPGSSPGIDVRVLDTVGIHGLDTCEVFFENVQVRAEDVVGVVGQGFRQLLGTLNGERLNAAAVALGIARGAQQEALRYAQQRQAFGRPISAFQVLQHRLVDGAIQLEATRGLLQRAARAADEGRPAESLSAMAKIAASDAASAITDWGMRSMGAAGYSREFPMQRFFRDARLYTFAPLTNEMLRNFVGERHLNLPRSY
jgi:acyl-CoA dehydrogenase